MNTETEKNWIDKWQRMNEQIKKEFTDSLDKLILDELTFWQIELNSGTDSLRNL